MATIQGQLNTPRDTTIQATNTALGLLGKDASLQDIKTALLAIVDAITPSIENDYDELTNKPQVNGVTLSGNKTSKQLGIRQTIPMNSAAYAQLTSAEKMDPDKDYIITDINATSAPIDDANISNNKVWSSQKTDNTKADKEAILQTVEECSASTDPDDIAGAAALSSLNSALANIGERVHSEGYTAYTVQNGGIINQITIPKNGTYLFTSYIRGASCWYSKNGVIFPNAAVVTADATEYTTVLALEEGDVIAQTNQTGTAQTYTASELSAIRIK